MAGTATNSSKMLLSDIALDLKKWKKQLNKSDINANREAFFNHIKTLNLRNSIFIDNTANQDIAEEYGLYLANNIGVVTCNKIACASSYKNYKELIMEFTNMILKFKNIHKWIIKIDNQPNGLGLALIVINLTQICSMINIQEKEIKDNIKRVYKIIK